MSTLLIGGTSNFLKMMLLYLIIVIILFVTNTFILVSNLFFPEIWNPNGLKVWKILYDDPQFFLINKGIDSNSWYVCFPKHEEYVLFIEKKNNGKIVTSIHNKNACLFYDTKKKYSGKMFDKVKTVLL